MHKRQFYGNLKLGSNYPTLDVALHRLVEDVTSEYKAEFVEVHQVIPHNESNFTVILNLYNK